VNLQKLYTEAAQDANSGQYKEAIRKFELILTHEMGADDKANVCALLGGLI
jgi:outer membrane protein assembly factor BamD (BamD/ComL family)